MLESIVPISKMRRLIEERTGADKSNTFYKVTPKVDDIPETYGKECNGVRLLLLGTIETAGGGCVCPENVMLKRIINNLVLHRDDIVIWIWKPDLDIWDVDDGRHGSVYCCDRAGSKKRTDLP